MKVEIDAATGLPVLPEGYWWNVDVGGWGKSTGGLSDQVLYVTVMRNSSEFGVVGRSIASNMVWGENPKAIRNAAIRLVKWDRDWKRHRAKVEYKQGTAYLRGDYPPKTLNPRPDVSKVFKRKVEGR